MQDMLHVTGDNIKKAQDRASKNPCISPWIENVLCMPHDSPTLSTGKCAKLAPHYFGPFLVLKRNSSFAIA